MKSLRTIKPFHAAVVATLLLPTLAGQPSARADATDHLVATGSGGSLSVTILVHGGDERDDLAITSPLQLGVSVIKQYDANKYIVVDDKQKIYTEMPLANAPLGINGIPNVLAIFEPAAPTRSKTVALAVSVTDLGVSNAPDVPHTPAHHYAIGISAAGSGQGTGDTGRLHSDLWADPHLVRPSAPGANDATHVVLMPGGGTTTYTLTGDVALYNQAISNLPVEVFGLGLGGTKAALTQVSESTTPLASTLFAVPAGYKLMSLADFSTAEQNAVLDLISGPQPKLPNAGSGHQSSTSAPASASGAKQAN